MHVMGLPQPALYKPTPPLATPGTSLLPAYAALAMTSLLTFRPSKWPANRQVLDQRRIIHLGCCGPL